MKGREGKIREGKGGKGLGEGKEGGREEGRRGIKSVKEGRDGRWQGGVQ